MTDICLDVWDTGIMRVTHCCAAACDIVSKRLLTFWITCFLLTLLLALVEWEFSWKDEVLFTLVIEWLWRRKGMGQKQGRLIVVTLMLTKQLVCKSGENCSDSNRHTLSGCKEAEVWWGLKFEGKAPEDWITLIPEVLSHHVHLLTWKLLCLACLDEGLQMVQHALRSSHPSLITADCAQN